MRKYIETGRITRPHGINGAVRAEVWCDSPAVLAGLGTVYTEKNGTYTGVRIAKGSVQKDHVILKFEGTDTPEAAELASRNGYLCRQKRYPGQGGMLSLSTTSRGWT